MRGIFQNELDAMLACDGKVVGVTLTEKSLQITLRSVVSLKDYKTLAGLDRQKGCSFDARTKTTTIPLVRKDAFRPAVLYAGTGREILEKKHPIHTMQYGDHGVHFYLDVWDDVALVVPLNDKGKSDLLDLVQRLGREDAKTFKSVKEAMAAQPSKRVTRAAQKSEDEDDYKITEVGIHEDADHDHE
ncbi:hypothetical protein [Burkholderia anthina]|uniref:hypothetical protein n=1 Tax=Burkholderia anthina TaxID=179879 RepID=UPI0037C0EA2D